MIMIPRVSRYPDFLGGILGSNEGKKGMKNYSYTGKFTSILKLTSVLSNIQYVLNYLILLESNSKYKLIYRELLMRLCQMQHFQEHTSKGLDFKLCFSLLSGLCHLKNLQSKRKVNTIPFSLSLLIFHKQIWNDFVLYFTEIFSISSCRKKNAVFQI